MLTSETKRVVLVTGSSGIVGRHVTELIHKTSKNVEIKRFNGDILDIANIRKQLKKLNKLDEVIHLAAFVPIDEVTNNPAKAFAVNVGGTCNLLNGIIDAGFKPHFFHCSSSHVYQPANEPLKEDGKLEPSSIYGKTKLISEMVCSEICSAIGLKFCIGRVFSIHDPAQTGTFLRPNIVKRLCSEDLSKEFNLIGGDSIRDFLLAREAAKLIVDLSRFHFDGVINIASGKPTKIRDFVQELASVSLNIKSLGESDTMIANIEKLTHFLKWSSKQDV